MIINDNMTLAEGASALASPNPGSSRVHAELAVIDPRLLLTLDALGVRGTDIWVAYADHFGRDAQQMAGFLAAMAAKQGYFDITSFAVTDATGLRQDETFGSIKEKWPFNPLGKQPPVGGETPNP